MARIFKYCVCIQSLIHLTPQCCRPLLLSKTVKNTSMSHMFVLMKCHPLQQCGSFTCLQHRGTGHIGPQIHTILVSRISSSLVWLCMRFVDSKRNKENFQPYPLRLWWPGVCCPGSQIIELLHRCRWANILGNTLIGVRLEDQYHSHICPFNRKLEPVSLA